MVKQLTDKLFISTELKTPAAVDFLQLTANLKVICNAITALVGPQQYDSGLAAIQQIKAGIELNHSHPNLQEWISVWSGLALIVNRLTLFHRDKGAAPSCFDLLIGGGTHTECNLDIPDLGATFSYLPGTAIALTGRVLRHGVRKWGGGERICFAHYMKDLVHNRLKLQRPDWTCIQDYLKFTHRN